MLILVINCGSSSVKYELLDVTDEALLCKGSVERIGEDSSVFKYQIKDSADVEKSVQCSNHHRAVEIIKDALVNDENSVLSNLDEVAGVGHRVVHGGEEFTESTLITDEVIKSIEKFSELAPLHNPPALEGIRGCMKIFEGVPQVAVFDTAFHHSMPKYAYCYGIPYEFYEKYGIRRYGFHGTSHRYVSSKAAEIIGKSVDAANIITVHLGNGCSIAAVKGSRSIDTSMGFTPLEGLLMGTRSGDLDPAVVLFLMEKEDISSAEVNKILNKQSGLLGVSGISNDMRDILKASNEGDNRAKLAYEIFVYRIKKYIGAYSAVLGSVDAVVFTGGIGQHVTKIRESIEKDLKGIFGDKVKFFSIQTNEELLIAKDTYDIVSKNSD